MAKNHDLHPHVLCLAGATATGKSEIALLLAEQLRGEIISVDSMQVYRGLDIGTAKPGPAERHRVPHHLIDVVDVTQPFDAAQFARLAHEAVREIHARSRLPILCGGTGLYFKAFLDGLGDAPPADSALRAQLEATPLADLLLELQQRDPATFEKIDRQNPRRIIRALEVIRLTGKPFSTQRAAWSSQPSTACPDISMSVVNSIPRRSFPAEAGQPLGAPKLPSEGGSTFLGLSREAKDLQTRINARVDLMFQRGLVEEVKQLLPQGLAENKTALQAIGYRQVVEYLHGQRSLPETIELVKIRTRQFAKRQLTWFRRQARLQWINCNPQDSSDSVAAQIVRAWNSLPKSP